MHYLHSGYSPLNGWINQKLYAFLQNSPLSTISAAKVGSGHGNSTLVLATRKRCGTAERFLIEIVSLSWIFLHNQLYQLIFVTSCTVTQVLKLSRFIVCSTCVVHKFWLVVLSFQEIFNILQYTHISNVSSLFITH